MSDNRKPLKVLLVEDSTEDVFFFQRALNQAGIEIKLEIVSDGRAAVNILKDPGGLLPDLIFLDLKMPLLDGFDVLRWILQQSFVPPLRIIVLSGSPHERDQSLATELGAFKYLVKPISSEVLRSHFIAAPSRSEN